nr:hypothetical protein [Tanacetum cinerariifolium]
MTIEEAKDLATLYLDKLVNKLKEQTSDDRNSQGVSDEDVDKEESKVGRGRRYRFGNKGDEISRQKGVCYNCEVDGHFVSECKKPKENKAFIGGAWSDSEDGNKPQNDATCLMAIGSQESNVSKLQDEALNFSKFKKSSIVVDDMLSRQKLSQDKEGLRFSKIDKTTS